MRIPVKGWSKDRSNEASGGEPRPDTPRDDAEGGGAPAEVEALRERVAALEAERDALDEKYKRTLADYHNSQRRAAQNERDARQRGVESVVESVITALDHFENALSHDASKMSAEQLVEGVKLIHEDLVRAVARHGAGLIEPKPNDEFDPMRHQAVGQHAEPGVAPGHVVRTLQTGYTLGDRTIRPAMVLVAPGAPDGEG